MTTDHENDSFFSALPVIARESLLDDGSDTEIDDFILTEMCKEIAAIFGGKSYDSQNFDYDFNDNRESQIRPSGVVEFVRKSLAGVQIDGMAAMDRFSMSLENPEEQRKLLEYFQKAKMERDREAREKAEQQEAERIKRQEQEKKEREEREAKAKKEKEEKERRERKERERRERRKRREKEEKERRERKEREAKEKAEREAKEKAEREAKEKAEREAKEKAEREAKEARENAERQARAILEAEAKARAEREQQQRDRFSREQTDMIEVAPGLTLPLLSKNATLRALESQQCLTTTCFACQQTLTAPNHVDFVVCCDDWICMAVEDDQRVASSSSARCIGFGVKDEAVAKWVMMRRSHAA